MKDDKKMLKIGTSNNATLNKIHHLTTTKSLETHNTVVVNPVIMQYA
jgi:hypothetical protein